MKIIESDKKTLKLVATYSLCYFGDLKHGCVLKQRQVTFLATVKRGEERGLSYPELSLEKKGKRTTSFPPTQAIHPEKTTH